MKLLVDMNLSPDWVPVLQHGGFEALHWSAVGAHNAEDTEIMQWARSHQAVVFTNDLDFGIALALTSAGTPSVIQIRAQDVSPQHLGPTVAAVLHSQQESLVGGALVTIDEARSRVRILPIRERSDSI